MIDALSIFGNIAQHAPNDAPGDPARLQYCLEHYAAMYNQALRCMNVNKDVTTGNEYLKVCDSVANVITDEILTVNGYKYDKAAGYYKNS